MRITFVTRKFGNVERNSHCDVLHITPIRVARLFLDCNGVEREGIIMDQHIVISITKVYSPKLLALQQMGVSSFLLKSLM